MKLCTFYLQSKLQMCVRLHTYTCLYTTWLFCFPQDYIGPLSELIRHCNDEVLLMEVLGVFSNLQIADLDYNRVLVELQLLEPLLKCFEVSLQYWTAW